MPIGDQFIDFDKFKKTGMYALFCSKKYIHTSYSKVSFKNCEVFTTMMATQGSLRGSLQSNNLDKNKKALYINASISNPRIWHQVIPRIVPVEHLSRLLTLF